MSKHVKSSKQYGRDISGTKTKKKKEKKKTLLANNADSLENMNKRL